MMGMTSSRTRSRLKRRRPERTRRRASRLRASCARCPRVNPGPWARTTSGSPSHEPADRVSIAHHPRCPLCPRRHTARASMHRSQASGIKPIWALGASSLTPIPFLVCSDAPIIAPSDLLDRATRMVAVPHPYLSGPDWSSIASVGSCPTLT